MTVMNLMMLFRADTAQARKGSAEMRSDLDALKSKAQQTCAAMTAAFDGSESAAQGAAAAVRNLGGALDLTRSAGGGIAPLPGLLTQTGGTATLAAQSVGNLAAQFNDIGMMMAAGQNPLMLAIQQGSQIGQVIGPMGAAGAVGALRAAFVSLLSPVNLGVMAIIALGAAGVQWLGGLSAEVVSVDQAMDSLTSAVDAYAKSAARARSPVASLTAEFGAQAGQMRELLKLQADADQRSALQASQQAAQALKDELGLFDREPGRGSFNMGSQVALADMFDLSMWNSGARGQINRVIGAADAATAANGLNDQIAAVDLLRQRFEAAAAASGQVTAEEQRVLDILNQQLIALTRIQAARQADAAARIVTPAVDALSAGIRTAADWAQDVQAANQLTAELNTQAEIQQLIAAYGEDSKIVALERARAEREAFVAMVDGLNVATALKDEVIAAWDAANGLASVDIATGISNAAGQAANLATNLASAAQNLWSMMQAKAAAQVAVDPTRFKMVGQYQLYGSTRRAAENAPASDMETYFNPPKVRGGRAAGVGGGGGGGGTSPLETDLREAQRLFDATRTDAERYATELARIDELHSKGHISTETHARAVEMIGEKYLDTGNAAKALADLNGDLEDAIVDMATGGVDSFGRLEDAMKRALAQALLFGKGPLAGAFGLTGSGLLGGLFSAILPGKADGGLLDGPGTGRSDSILLRASKGEFVVNAASTKKHLPLLKAINADVGPLPAFADGGVVGAASALRRSVGVRSDDARAAVFEINVSGTGAAEIRAGVHEAIRVAFDQHVNRQLPGLVRTIVNDRWSD